MPDSIDQFLDAPVVTNGKKDRIDSFLDAPVSSKDSIDAFLDAPEAVGFKARAIEIGRKAITPITPILKAKETFIDALPGPDLRFLMKPSESPGMLGAAETAAKSALVPTLQTVSPKLAAEFNIPVSPLDIGIVAGSALGGVAGRIFRAPKVAPVTNTGKVISAIDDLASKTPNVSVVEDLERITDVLRKSQAHGVDVRFILTESERKLLDKFRPQIESAANFRIPIRPLISEAEVPSQVSARTRIATEQASQAPLDFGIAPKASPTSTPSFDLASRMNERASGVVLKLNQTVESLSQINDRTRIVMPEAETIAETGTLSKEGRVALRESTPPTKSDTFMFRVSESDVRQGQAEVVDAVREFHRLRDELVRDADPLSVNTSKAIGNQLNIAVDRMNQATKNFQKQRFAAGRTVKAWDKPVPQDVIDTLREQGMMLQGMKNIRQKLPLATNILNTLKNWDRMTNVEKFQFGRDIFDHYRLNLFSLTSWTLDLVGNMSEISGQLAGGAARDLVHIAEAGKVSFPSIQGFARAMRERAFQKRFQPMIPEIEEALGRTASGEMLPGSGVFTMREGFGAEGSLLRKSTKIGSTIYDYIVGGPMYLKGAIDTAAKRLMGTATIWRDAIEEADRLGLSGSGRRNFFQEFQTNIPERTIKNAIENANKAGFNRELTKLEESIASSMPARLLVDVFARWPFQFSRWGAEMLGYNGPLFSRVRNGTAGAREIAEYLGKTATGWGGMYLLDNIYDRVDFNSLEYVHQNGDRTRLSNRDPINSGLFLLAVLKRDWDAATGSLKFASIPGAKLMSGEGGVLGSTLMAFKRAAENPINDPRSLRKEFDDALNRAIPGEAILNVIKTIFDPTVREGVGSGIPGVSRILPPAISATTGEPLNPRQRILGIEMPTFGAPIPGARRILDPVHQLLSRYGLVVYRGPRTPVAGFPAGQVPEDLRREWIEAFGKNRNRLLKPFADNMQKGLLESENPDEIRKEISDLDAVAAEIATLDVSAKHGKFTQPGRTPSAMERRRPKVFQ